MRVPREVLWPVIGAVFAYMLKQLPMMRGCPSNMFNHPVVFAMVGATLGYLFARGAEEQA